jgi:hypothetical protein
MIITRNEKVVERTRKLMAGMIFSIARKAPAGATDTVKTTRRCCQTCMQNTNELATGKLTASRKHVYHVTPVPRDAAAPCRRAAPRHRVLV